MTPAEVVEDVFRLLGVEGPEDAATVVLSRLDDAGMAVVSAEDLRAVLGEVWSPEFYSAVLPRLRAALPEETTTDG